MLLRASPALSLFSSLSEAPPPVAFLRHRQPMSGVLRITRTERSSARIVAATGDASNKALTGFLFEPFEEVQHELALVPSSPDKSLARQKYVDECEAAINEQINVEYNVSYVYHAMFSYFDRDNVALRGMAKFFKESSEEEREHAEKLMKYQNKRGGRVKLQSILMPLTEFNHEEKGDALYDDNTSTLLTPSELDLWKQAVGEKKKGIIYCLGSQGIGYDTTFTSIVDNSEAIVHKKISNIRAEMKTEMKAEMMEKQTQMAEMMAHYHVRSKKRKEMMEAEESTEDTGDDEETD